jgi:hypothetical protein
MESDRNGGESSNNRGSEASGDVNGPGRANGPDAVPTPPTVKPRAKATIMELARYKVGQRVWWVVFRAEKHPEIELAEEWMKAEHPWMLWRRKAVPWSLPMRPPRMHPTDTMAVLMLFTQRPKIEAFVIKSVERSANSGEFLYTGPNEMVMPEGLLFPTRKAARKEIARVARLFAAWTGAWVAGAEDTRS